MLMIRLIISDAHRVNHAHGLVLETSTVGGHVVERAGCSVVARQLLHLVSELMGLLHVGNVALFEILETLLPNLIRVHILDHI